MFRNPRDREHPFVMVSRALIDTQALSWQAKGVMVYLLSKPDDWITSADTIARQTGSGHYQVAGIVRELEAGGFVTRHRASLEDGTWQWEMLVHEAPVPALQRTTIGAIRKPRRRNTIGKSATGQMPANGLPANIPKTDSTNNEYIANAVVADSESASSDESSDPTSLSASDSCDDQNKSMRTRANRASPSSLPAGDSNDDQNQSIKKKTPSPPRYAAPPPPSEPDDGESFISKENWRGMRRTLCGYFTSETAISSAGVSFGDKEKRWYQPLRHVLALAGGDIWKAQALIRQTIAVMRAKNLTIVSPQSIEQMAAAVAANPPVQGGAGERLG